MSYLDDYFQTYAMPAMQHWSSDTVTYTPEGEPPVKRLATIGASQLMAKNDPELGEVWVQSRLIMFPVGQVADPQINAVVTINGVNWTIAERVSGDPTNTCVRVEIPAIHERSRPGLRHRT